MAQIGIIDYNIGNMGSVANALRFLGYEPLIMRSGIELQRADGIILPGVGAFGRAMANLAKRDFIAPLNEFVLGKGLPFLGICVGMQLLATGSEENEGVEGLGWIDSKITELLPHRRSDTSIHRPHVGWNEVTPVDVNDPLFTRLSGMESFFFDHTYSFEASAPHVSAFTDYHEPVPAMMRKDNIHAAQFHPEKSQRAGLIMMRNFTKMVEASVARKCA